MVSVERPLSPPSDGLVSPPLVNGEIKPGKANVPIVSINTNNDRESGSASPRQQSLVSSTSSLAPIISHSAAGTVWSEVDLRSNNEEEAGEGGQGGRRESRQGSRRGEPT